MDKEYKKLCDECLRKGDAMFARIYPMPINGVWMWLCKDCWNKHDGGKNVLAKL
jgi:hypothetical protein